MTSAFVAKLAAHGAHNPEALAAWIGRKKHGAAAFGKLAAVGRRNAEKKGPQPGPVGVARHYTGLKVFGSADMIAKVAERKDYDSATSSVGVDAHDVTLARTSPAFQRKAREARDSGFQWIHQIQHDSGGAEIHNLITKDPTGKTQQVKYLERSSAAWKRLSRAEQDVRRQAAFG